MSTEISKKHKRALTPLQRDLMEFPTFYPTANPERRLLMERVIMREGRPTPVKVLLSSEHLLPEVKHRHYIDVLTKKWVDLGKPKDRRIPIDMLDIFAVRGVSKSGYNYRTFYDAVLKYKAMNITFFDAWPSKKAKDLKEGKTRYYPKVSGKNILEEYDLERPDARTDTERERVGGSLGWVRFTSWYTDSLDAKGGMRLVDLQILASLDVGYTYRVFEFVTKKMGLRPVWRIGLLKLGQAIPFVKEREIRIQVQAIKRVVKQLMREEAFKDIRIDGRGEKSIVTFIKADATDRDLAAVAEEEAEDIQQHLPEMDNAEIAHVIDERLGQVKSKRNDHNYSHVLSDMTQLMALEARDNGDSSKPQFMEMLELSRKGIQAAIAKWSPPVPNVVDAYEETRLAYREGRVNTTVRQFFLDKVKRYAK